MKKLLVILAIIGIAVCLFVYLQRDDAEEQEIKIAATKQSFFIAEDGDDANDGSIEEPFQTLEKASEAAIPGTTVYIRGGTYYESLQVNHSGTKTEPIVFQAYDGEEVIISGEKMDDAEEDTALASINDKSYITIKGLTFTNLSTELADETVIGIYVTGNSSHISIENNTVRNIETFHDEGNGHGIAVYATEAMKDITIKDNLVENLKLGASEALVLNGNIDGFQISHNTVRDNDNIGIDMIGYEGTSEENDYVRNGAVESNIVYNNSSYGNPAYGEDYSAGGIYIDGGRNITVDHNIVHHNDLGIEATSEHHKKYAVHIDITSNTVYENNYTGISIGGYDTERGGTKNSTIAKNILYKNDTKGLDGGQLMLQHDTSSNKIEKNVFSSSENGLFIINYFTANSSNILSSNVYHLEEDKETIWVWKDEEYTSLASFETAADSDSNSSILDLGFADPENGDFTLTSDSPVKNIIE
ncbi:right-handed parallel beta-helix repeat-containing protein [Niallia sp. FSL R7-0271]|uniref:right-handed parallel beta-helix repeat-containing protein n=1 Tax=Niallia sp. FSL R7-0271 TaxID=2921678 RepID=UPI0030F618A4